MKYLLTTSIAFIAAVSIGSASAGSWTPQTMSFEQVTATLDGEYEAQFAPKHLVRPRVDIAVMEFRLRRSETIHEDSSPLNRYLQDTDY